jgi:hypothetical protein
MPEIESTERELPTLGDAIEVADGELRLPSSAARHVLQTFSAVHFYEDGADPAGYRGGLVLAPGLPAVILDDVRERLAAAGVAGLVVRAAGDEDPDAPTGRVTMPTMYLHRADWAQLADALRSLLSAFSIGAVKGVRLGDVFGLANALATIAAGAVSIVDATGQVVGYSTHPEQPIDDIRRRTTLLLQEELPIAQDPDYRQLVRSTRALHFPSTTDQYGRVGVAVRAAGELLGTIWVVQILPDTASKTEAMLDELAPVVAQHLLRSRANAADKDRHSAESLRALVEDERDARHSASQLLLRPEAGCTLVCFRVNTYDEVDAVRGLQRVMHLAMSVATSTFPGSYSAIIGPQVVALIPEAVPARVRSFAETVIRSDPALVAGIGTRVTSLGAIPRSYRESAATAMLLMTSGADVAGAEPLRAASFDDVRDRLAVRQLGDVIDGLDVTVGDAAGRLLDHDTRTAADLTRTMLTYLNLHGSVRETAEALHVHQNTVRYRLEVVRNDLGIDLDDPYTRLWLWLRLVTAGRDAPHRDALGERAAR